VPLIEGLTLAYQDFLKVSHDWTRIN
jgi:hypothetical protein